MRKAVTNTVKKERRKYRIDYLRVILIISLIYFSVTFVRQQLSINEYNVQLKSIKQDINQAREKTIELNEIKEKVNDSDYIEKVAREDLGLVKPYEKVFIDVDK